MKTTIYCLDAASFASYAQPQFADKVGGYDNSGTKKFLMLRW